MCAKSQTQLSLTPKPLRILEIITQQTIFIYSRKPIVSQTQKQSSIGQGSAVAFSLVKEPAGHLPAVSTVARMRT